jgi:hypothetical protein
LAPIALPVVPAPVLALAAGAVLSLVGLPPETLPPVLLARGDALFFVAAYAVGVAVGWASERRSDRLP